MDKIPADKEIMLRDILRNQREIMLALMRICLIDTTEGRGASAVRLRERIIGMERKWDWLVPPSQRL